MMDIRAMFLSPTFVSKEIPGILSQTAYETKPEDRDAILRICTFHDKDFDRSVIWFPQGTHWNLFHHRLPINSKPATTLGELETLPLELVNMICLEMDVASLFRFRQVNTRARQIIAALREYRIVTLHAMDALRALLQTNSAPTVTLQAFYSLLCTSSCSLCGTDHGNLVHLLLWIRCCSRCLNQQSIGIRVATVTSVKRVLKLSDKTMEKLPKLTIIPGGYTWEMSSRPRSVSVVHLESALYAYPKLLRGMEETRAKVKRLNARRIYTFMACCALPSFDPRNGQVQNGVSCIGCRTAAEKSINWRINTWACEMRDAIWSHDGFLKHFTHCEQAQLLRKSSNGGTEKP